MKINTLFVISLFAFAQCSVPEPGSPEHINLITSSINDQALINASGQSGDWLTYGLNYQEDRFSELSQINQENVDSLGLVWSLELGTKQGIEATPLVVDGVMYLTGPWSLVYAVNTRSGELIWSYDPKVPGYYGPKACCDVVNRGAALYQGHVYAGTIDGRLLKVNAVTGELAWEVQTVDTSKYYTITGAPRIVKGNVIIGNGGAEYGVRGYVSAYDAETGDMAWRFYTVPGDPSQPFESPAMEAAAQTWTGEWWKYGGGGTAWDAMAFDPDLNLLYVGTGNGSPWNRIYRSPGGGDNLYLSSIVALNPDDGSLVWYYQTTPGDTWDYTATQHIMLADLEIEGTMRKVLMQAPKNGFFYVIDRETGELLSADAYTYVNWAQGVDMTTGRPIENDFSRYQEANAFISPNYYGGHNWQPMAFNPQTNLVYIPSRENAAIYGNDPNWVHNERGIGAAMGLNLGIGFDPDKPMLPDSVGPGDNPKGMLIAWDPLQKKVVWRVDHQTPWNAGVLSTAGNLVFQGTAEGKLVAYKANDGEKLWETSVGSGVVAPPVTYTVDDVQYLSIAVGWGGAWGKSNKNTEHIYPGRIYTFALGANEPAPTLTATAKELINGEITASETQIQQGAALMALNCGFCHGDPGGGGGNIPDLAYSSASIHENFQKIVREGMLLPLGMPNFGDKLTEEEVNLIQQYIFSKAQAAKSQIADAQ